MESLYVLNIAAVRNAVKDCIDRPSSLSEKLKQNCLHRDKPVNTWILQGILDKLSRHADDFKAPTSPIQLYNLVKDVTISMREEIPDVESLNKTILPSISHIFDKRRLRTVETINTNMYRDLEKKTKTLRGLVNNHQKLITAIQKAQQECWIGRSKVNKYKLMIETARASREHLKDELSKKGLKVRDNAIKDLEKTLKIKEGKYDSATMTYCKLRCQVEATANQMKQISDDIRNSLMSELLDRMEETLITLTNFSKTVLSQDSHKAHWEKVEAINLREIVNSVLSRGQMVYTYPDPCKYTRMDGFDKHIPMATYYQRGERMTSPSTKYLEQPVSIAE